MLYREIMVVCSEIHTKHINTLCGQNVEFANVKPVAVYYSIASSFLSKASPSLPKVQAARMDAMSHLPPGQLPRRWSLQ